MFSSSKINRIRTAALHHKRQSRRFFLEENAEDFVKNLPRLYDGVPGGI